MLLNPVITITYAFIFCKIHMVCYYLFCYE